MMFIFCRATKGTEMWQVEEVGPPCLLRNTLGELQRQSGNKYGKQPQTLHLKWPNYGNIFGEKDRNMEKNMEANGAFPYLFTLTNL